MPSTSSTLLRMLPSIDCWTRRSWLLLSATMPTMASTALPTTSVSARGRRRARTGRVQQSTERLTEPHGDLLGRIAEEAGERDDRAERDDEVGRAAPAGKVRRERERHGDEQDVDPRAQEESSGRLDEGRSIAMVERTVRV